MAKIEAKQVVVNEIKDKLERAQGVVLVSSRGLTVAQDTEMRRAMREAGVDFKVYKNTMVNFAIKDTPFEPLASQLEGPTAVAFSYDDATSGARVLDKFVSSIEPLTLKAGVFEGTYYDAEDVAKIGKIPPREQLLSRLLGSFQSPMASFARVVKEIAKKNGGETAEAAE
ncbi:MAG: 50S ribosomal protein L10 [Firmicutes bacterium]|nr:50S ribosomal protein L10 [Bacillota bacterium]